MTVNMIRGYSFRSFYENPAILSSSYGILLVDDTKVIGEMRMISGFGDNYVAYAYLSVDPDDDATKEFFKDDPNWVNGTLFGLRYDGVTGEPYIHREEDEGRHKGTRIVSKIDFEFGICHESFRHIEGFDSYHKKQRLRIHTVQKSRRRRNSNKIRKVARVA